MCTFVPHLLILFIAGKGTYGGFLSSQEGEGVVSELLD